jgi:hypothetical protein
MKGIKFSHERNEYLQITALSVSIDNTLCEFS